MFIDFLKENFFYLHPGYTTFNTIIFGIVLGIIVLAILKVFDMIDKDPLDLLFPLIPIILFGSTSRALVDNHIYPRIYLLATPGIYIFIGLMTLFLLIFSVIIEKYYKIKYYKIIFTVGSVFCTVNLIILIIHGMNFKVLSIELFLWILLTELFALIKNKLKILSNKGNLEVLSAHILDATSTFIAMDFFGYYEQHVFPTFLINIFGSAIIMYPLKIIVILAVLYLIDNKIDDCNTIHLLKLTIFILGLAPGIRNISTLILSLC